MVYGFSIMQDFGLYTKKTKEMRKKEKKRQKELERKKEEEQRKLEEGSEGEGSFKIHVSCTDSSEGQKSQKSFKDPFNPKKSRASSK